MYLVEAGDEYKKEIQFLLKEYDLKIYVKAYIFKKSLSDKYGYITIYTGLGNPKWIYGEYKDGKLEELNENTSVFIHKLLSIF